jgi:choline dehydrogenase-like flavoprotein
MQDGAYGGHHIGTARMADTAAQGVVDAECQVHGMRNLFVSGSAVFPTSSQANPTLTIVALAVRLAERLKKEDVLF